MNAPGHVLLVKHTYGLRRFSLPGGVVEAGETPEEAAVREAREEVGVSVKLREFVGTYLTQGGGRPDVTSYIYTAVIVSGRPSVSDPAEIAQLGWFHPTRLPAPMTNDSRPAIADVLEGRRGVERTIQRPHDQLPG